MSTDTATRGELTRRLTRISRALTYARSFDEVLDLTTECASDLLDVSRVVLMLSEDDGLLRVRASRGIDQEVVERFREPLDETLLSRLEELMGPNAREHFLGVPLVVQGEVIGLLAVRRERRDRSEKEEEWLLSALADQAAVALESTRSRELQEMLNRRVDELAAEKDEVDQALKILAHDLRSPISAIQSYTALLDGEILGPRNDRQHEALVRIDRICEHLESIVSTVLELARLSERPADLQRARVPVEDVVERALDVVRPSARNADIDLATRGEPSQEVEGDIARLRQVLVQLLDNAVKYSPDGNPVTVEWGTVHDDEGRWTEIMVTDRGPGVPDDQKDAIFQPYVSHQSGQDRAGAGVGLGLAIARDAVRRMGGTLTLENRSGAGSSFRVRLPLDRAG